MNDQLLALKVLHNVDERIIPWATILQWLSHLPWAQIVQILVVLLPLLKGGKLDPTVIAWITQAIVAIAAGKVTLAWVISAIEALVTGQPLPPLP
jgi:hypothetical protein